MLTTLSVSDMSSAHLSTAWLQRCVARYLLLFSLLFALPLCAYAQSNGKISGTVRDASTGESLPGVTVYLEQDTNIGTISDVNGKYFMLSVPPGTYTVIMSYVGFATVKTENVQVFSGRTTNLDMELKEEVIQGEEIIVSAERPIVVRDRTTTVSYVAREAIEKLPVQEVRDLVKFQPGVVTNSTGGFNFRGGRQRETAYIVDGIPVQDVFNQGGGNTIDVEVQSVQELQVYTGTFDAELGGAQSGVVSITTRDPAQKLEGSFRAQASGFFAGDDDIFIGGDSFDPLESQDYSITLNGPLVKGWSNVGFFLNGRYEDRVGHFKGQRLFTAEDGFKIDTYRRWYRDVFQPGDTRLIALDTARTPSGAPILDSDGNPITFSSGDGSVVDMDWERVYTVNPKLVMRPTSRSKLTVSGLYNNREEQNFSSNGDALRRFAPDFRSTSFSESITGIINFKQTIGNNKVLNVRGSYKTAEYESYTFRDPSDPNVQFASGSDDVTGFSLGQTDNGRSLRTEDQIIASADFTWQINERNEFKTGVQFRSNKFVIEDLDREWINPADSSIFLNLFYPDANRFASFDEYFAAVSSQLPALVQEDEVPQLAPFIVNDRFDQSPVEYAFFIQDKLEFDSRLVVKAGVRFEMFDVREQHLVDVRTPTDRIGRSDNFTDTDPKYYVSPRLGISYPISANGAFRVAYGHFVQMPAYREIFKNPIFDGINVGRLEGRTVGNPDLDPERTIKYEMGLQQQLTDFVGIDLNLFYKNIRNLLGVEILGTLDNVQYRRTVNRDYGLVRGGTLAIVTRPVGFLLGTSFDITYSDARGSSSSADDVANVVVAGRSGEVGDFFLERNITALDWDQTLTANLSAQIGESGNWSVGFISQLATGQPYTPSFLDPTKDFPDNEFDNGEQKPVIFTFDMSAEKRFTLRGVQYGLRLQVDNLFNYLNERTVNSISGRADQIVRLPVVEADREMVKQAVGLFGNEDDINPQWYSAPRQIRLALTVNF